MINGEVKVEFSIWFKDVYSELISIKKDDEEILSSTYHPGSSLDSATIIFTQFRTGKSFILPLDKNQISRFNTYIINFKINNIKKFIEVSVGNSFFVTFKLKSDVNRFTISTSTSRPNAQNNFELLSINQKIIVKKNEQLSLSIYDFITNSKEIKNVRKIKLENSTLCRHSCMRISTY